MTDLQPQTQPAEADAQQTIERLTARLERVEGQLKRLQYAVPALVILAVASLIMQLNEPSTVNAKTVVAESFSVQNAKGDIVVRLGTTSAGAANIAFFDAQQKIRLMAGLRANGGPSLSLFDQQE